MRFEQLEYLIELSRRKSMNAAAEHLHISQQALSLAVRNLEDELGAKLLDRNYQGIKLTPEGIEAVKRAKKIIEQTDDMKTHFRKQDCTHQALRGTIEIFASYIAVTTFFGDFIAGFRKKHPMVRLNVQEYDTARIVEQMLNAADNDLLIGLVDGHSFKSVTFHGPDIEYRPLRSDKLLACVSRYSPLAGLKQVSIRNLLKYPFICYYTLDLSKLIDSGAQIEIAMTTSNSFLYMQAIIDNLGVGLMPSSALNNVPYFQRVHEDTVLIPLKEPFNVEVGYLRAKQAATPALMQVFMRELTAYIG